MHSHKCGLTIDHTFSLSSFQIKLLVYIVKSFFRVCIINQSSYHTTHFQRVTTKQYWLIYNSYQEYSHVQSYYQTVLNTFSRYSMDAWAGRKILKRKFQGENVKCWHVQIKQITLPSTILEFPWLVIGDFTEENSLLLPKRKLGPLNTEGSQEIWNLPRP